MIWAYYIELSRHMWADKTAKKDYFYLPKGSVGDLYGYNEENQIDVETWDKIIAYLAKLRFNTAVIDLGDQIAWESHPEICAPGEWTKEFFKTKLDEIRALGITPIPKLNFSACHDTWLKEYRRTVGSDIYRKVCADLIDEAIELFEKPALFHLGLDEETSVGCHMHSEAIVIRGPELLWHDYRFLFDCCFKKGVQPWMWADYFWDRNELFIKNVSKEIMLSNWYYHSFFEYKEDSWLKRSMDAYIALDKLGYEQITTGSTVNGVNNCMFETMTHCKENCNSIKGYMTASWYATMPDELLSLKNDAFRFYRGRELVYPESLL